MEISKITENQFLESLKLSEYAFQFKVPDEELDKRFEFMKKHPIYGIFEDGGLAAKLHHFSFEIIRGNDRLKMGGIAGVATFPEHRRRGFVKALLKDILIKMKEEGQTISMLSPFSIAFYRKYGWELFSNRMKTTIQKADLIMQETVSGEIQRFLGVTKLNDVNMVYEQYASAFVGMLVRTEDWWKDVIDDQNGAIYYDSKERPRGYILYRIKDSKMEVEEFIALDSDARRGLWNFICQHDSMINSLEITTHEREPLFFSLHNPRVKREVNPYFMVRIVDVMKFLQDYCFSWEDNIDQISLHITDEHAAWNTNTYLLSREGVSVIEAVGEIAGGTIHLPINALSTILFGYQRPVELHQAGMVTGDKAEIMKLEKMVPQQQPFFYDFF